MIYIDIKYANMLLPRLDKWSVKRQMPYLANGRCPYCGDSTKNKFTRRGYILQKSSLNYLLYYCHKCGKSTTLSKMLSETNPDLYKDYRVEMIKESSGGG